MVFSFGITYAACYVVGLLYPTYLSFRALLTRSSADDTHWLTYWVVYSFLQTAETLMTSFFLWIPFWYEIKLVFLLWLVLPQTKGAQLIFERFLAPALSKYGAQIDPTFAKAKQYAQPASATKTFE